MSGTEVLAVALAAVALLAVGLLAMALRSTRQQLDGLRESLRQSEPDPRPEVEGQAEAHPLPTVTAVVPYDITGRDDTVYVPTREQVTQAAMNQPLVRVAALSHGVRRAMQPANRDKVASLMRREFRRRRKMRMRAGRRAARMARMEPVDAGLEDEHREGGHP